MVDQLIPSTRPFLPSAHGFGAAFPIADALGDLDAVDIAVVYGVPAEGSGASLAVAAVTLLEGSEIEDEDLAAALSVLPAEERPDVVWVVDDIPVTTWFGPSSAARREAGVPAGHRVWRREGQSYAAR